MLPYSVIVLIYNPNSTNDAEAVSLKLSEDLAKTLPKATIKRVATERAGHAIELVGELAVKYERPLIVSVSGDGGYHEVVNGAMRVAPGRRPFCMVAPAGNANDHHGEIAERSVVQAISHGEVSEIDLLRVEIEGGDVQFAHSYAGLGISSAVAAELNRHSLNALREAWIVLRSFWRFQPLVIRQNGKKRQLHSLIFANIRRMAKVLTVSESGTPTDGKMEVIEIPASSKWRLIGAGLIAAFTSLRANAKVSEYTFETMQPTPLQLDGEVVELKANSKVKISVAGSAIKTVV